MRVQLHVIIAIEVMEILGGNLAGDIVFAGLETAHARGALRDKLIENILRRCGDLAGVARRLALSSLIIVVTCQMNVLILLPLHKLIGTGADIVGDARVARGVDNLGGNDRGILGVVAQNREEIRGGRGKRAGHLVVARRSKLGIGKQTCRTIVDFKPAVHRGDDVVGAKLLAVVEHDAFSQLDGIDQSVVGDLVALGENGLGFVLGVEAKKRLHDIAGNIHGHKRRRGMRIETIRARRERDL